MRIAYTNLVDATAVTFVASTADASYPVANIQDQRLSTRWRTTTRSVGSVIIDLGASTSINTVAVAGHNLSAAVVLTLTGSENLNGSAWNDKSQVGSSLSVSAGAPALAALTASQVAYIDDTLEQLRTYSWSGSVWSQLGSSLAITGAGVPALAALTASQIAYVDDALEQLRTYAWSSSVWSQVGSSLAITGIGAPALAALTASTTAYIDSDLEQLRTYAWSGSVWSQLGSSLSIAGTGAPALAALTFNTIAYTDNDLEQLRTYTWSGSVWSQLGSSLSIASAGTPACAALTASTIAYIDSDLEQLRTYTWSGSVWSQTGSSLAITGTGAPAFATLSASRIAYIDSQIAELRTYSVNATIGPQEVITYDAGISLKFFTSIAKRYWMLDIVEQASTGSYIEMGRVWLGTYITVDPSSLVDFRITKKRSDIVIYGKHRQKWADPGYGWRRFELSFPETDASMLTQIETMYDTVGNHSSLIFCNFDTDRSWSLVTPCYASIEGDLSFVGRGSNRARWTMTLEEDR